MKKNVFPLLTPIETELGLDEYVRTCYRVIKDLEPNEFLQHFNNSLELYERNYVITFSYYLGCDYSSLLKDDVINGELSKKIDIRTRLMSKTLEDLKYSSYDKYVSFVPDFVIHTNESNRKLTPETQKLIMEVKTTPHLTKKGFNWDFFKLNVYLNKLKYRNAVYLILNTSKVKIDKLLASYFSEKHYYDEERISQLLFIIQEGINEVPLIYKLQK